MKYDGKNPLHAQQARTRLEKLIREGKMFELTEKKPQRTISQNSYLWLTINYWATQTGYSKEYAESIYKDVNSDIYYTEIEVAGRIIKYVRHTYELSTDEMSKSIDKWRNWAAMNDAYPVYIPSPEDSALVALMELEVERARNFI